MGAGFGTGLVGVEVGEIWGFGGGLLDGEISLRGRFEVVGAGGGDANLLGDGEGEGVDDAVATDGEGDFCFVTAASGAAFFTGMSSSLEALPILPKRPRTSCGFAGVGLVRPLSSSSSETGASPSRFLLTFSGVI